MLQAKYEDKAVTNYTAKAKAEGKAFKPQMGPGVPTPPVPAVAPAAASVAAAAAGAKPAATAATPAKK